MPRQTKSDKVSNAVNAIATNSTHTLKSKAKDKTQNEINVNEPSAFNDFDDNETNIEFNSAFKVTKKSSDINYKKLELHSQILLRPDTYIGSVKNVESLEPIFVFKNGKIIKQTVSYPEGLVRIFIEVISNSIDNVWRSLEYNITPRFLKITIDRENNKISVWNDGKNIPIDDHKEENIPIPEMIFGHLLTSSNYNDEEERKTSGRNGYGVKLCNIFSSLFNINIFNRDVGAIYEQNWTDNMRSKTKPVLSKKGFPKTVEEGKNGYTCVSFCPDLSKFGLDKITDDIYSILEKIVYDTAMTVSLSGVKTYFNDNLIVMESIKDYVKLYFDEIPEENMMLKSEDCRVFVCPADEFTQVSFVNGVYTKDGGVHVDGWCETIFRPIVQKINGDSTKASKKKTAKNDINIRDIKKHFFIFVYANLDKPSFDNQSKTRLNSPLIKTDIKKTDITKISKWSFIEKIEESLKYKELQNLKGLTERKKGVVKVEGLDDANYAGNKDKALECYLVITEGDSAKTYVTKGMKYGIQGKSGHDYIGVLPIRGKFLNVKNASVDVLINNKEVKSLIQSLGLQHGIDYNDDTNYKKLRYGKLMLATDSDVDGFHITGLMINFFHTLFPSLLQRKGFFYFMRTPIVKISHNRKQHAFYFQSDAKEFIEEKKPKNDNIKYYKGLGTSNADDVKEDFAKRIVEIDLDKEGDELMINVFGKENSDFRKKWISSYNDSIHFTEDVKDYEVEDLKLSQFINQELILFSIDDCKRSIPSMIDGLKESHRKVLYCAFKRNLTYGGKSVKVAQFAGYVAEHSNYHHGEQNLYETITKLAQRFVGSNNIPLLFNDGQFGSRLELGKDAASGRYIFTKLDMLTRYIFRKEDDDFLPDRVDDGDIVEKEHYIPIIPTLLVNGITAGIGTGWSCNVPCYNPEDLVQNIKLWLNNKPLLDLIPWYRNFKGNIIVDENNVTTYGCFNEEKAKGTYTITEIPIGRKNISISKYKKKVLEDLKEEGDIKSFNDNSTDDLIHYTIKADSDFKPTMQNLDLIDTIQTNNMVLFNMEGKIVKYNNVREILEDFCAHRLKFYNIRKQGIIKVLEDDLKYLRNKIRFIKEFLDNKISLKNRDEDELEKELETKQYDKKESNEKLSYDYLLSIQVRTMTDKKLQELINKEKDDSLFFESYKKKDIKTIWIEELDEFLKHYKIWCSKQEYHTKK